jgi:hypothetical protein
MLSDDWSTTQIEGLRSLDRSGYESCHRSILTEPHRNLGTIDLLKVLGVPEYRILASQVTQ